MNQKDLNLKDLIVVLEIYIVLHLFKKNAVRFLFFSFLISLSQVFQNQSMIFSRPYFSRENFFNLKTFLLIVYEYYMSQKNQWNRSLGVSNNKGSSFKLINLLKCCFFEVEKMFFLFLHEKNLGVLNLRVLCFFLKRGRYIFIVIF